LEGYLYFAECRIVPGRLQPFLQLYHDIEERESIDRAGVNSRSKKPRKLDQPVSMFMFLVNCNEAFGYTHEQTLDSSYSLLQCMLSEYSYMWNERNADTNTENGEIEGKDFEWVELPDFNDPTKTNRYKKYKDVGGRIGNSNN